MAYRVRVIPRMKRRINRFVVAANNPCGLHVIESYLTSSMLKDNLLCNLSPEAVQGLDAISAPATYSKRAILFVEGQDADGAFVICNGRVKLSTSSAGGRALMLSVAEGGEVVGLPGTITGKPYEVTAEALEDTQVNFIPRGEFLQFLREHGDAALRVAEMLCHIYHSTYQEVKYLGLSTSASEKLARFILDLEDSRMQDNGPVRTALVLTHEEIAALIGCSRETVTRLFASFKKKQWVEVRGSTLIVKDKPALQGLVED